MVLNILFKVKINIYEVKIMKKMVFILCLAICVVFAISGVCAGDINDTVVASDDGQVIYDVDEEKVVCPADKLPIASSQNEDVINAASGTFTELQNKIDAAAEGSTITLDKDYKYNSGFSVKGIEINKDLTINGKGHTLDGLSKARIFDVSSKNVILNNINFVNGNANNKDGGAISAYSSNFTVNSCKFINNKANNGGAIFLEYGEIDVKNSVFNKNSAKNSGGAIGTIEDDDPFTTVFGYNYDTTIHVMSSTFTSNSANKGGAIQANTDLRVASSKFTSNKASDDGGALYVCSGLLTFSSSYKSNKASGGGGAIYISTGNNMILDSVFAANSASWLGGAIYFDYRQDDKDDASFISHSKFIGNIVNTYEGDLSGGAIYKYKGDNVLASECSFYKNKVYIEKGGVKKYDNIVGIKTESCVFLKDKLVLKKVNVKKSASKLVLKATLKQGKTPLKGQKIIFNFNGKNYKAKTNKKGVAKFVINKKILNKLKVGKKVKYQASYDLLKVKRTTRVKK